MTTWIDIKQKGSDHYKHPDDVEPIDLYKSGGILRHFAIGCIVKYAFRNRAGKINPKDIEKIIHYTEMLGYLADHENEDSKP